MADALQKAFETAGRLPEREQDEALDEHRVGRTRSLDPDAL